MSLLERFFQSAFDTLSPRRNSCQGTDSAALFSQFRERLTCLGASFSPVKIALDASPILGLHGNVLHLPIMIDIFPTVAENYEVFKLRLVIEMLTMAHLYRGGAILTDFSLRDGNPIHLAVDLTHTPLGEFIADMVARLHSIASACPARRGHIDSLLLFRPPTQSDVRSLLLAAKDMDGHLSLDGNKESMKIHLAAVVKVQQVQLDSEDMNPLVHVFEKVKTLDDYLGGNKQIDEEDENDAHARALEELKLDAVLRTNRTGGGFIERGMSPNVEAECPSLSASQPTLFRYDEWDGDKRRYRMAWCQVREQRLMSSTASIGAGELANLFDQCRTKGLVLRQQLTQFLNSYRWQRRQIDGPEIDLSALIDCRVEQLRGGQPLDCNFLNRRKRDLDFAVTILCDGSLSTDSWVDGVQIHAIIQEAAVILSYALADISCNWSAARFSSFTRHDCHYQVLKDFDESPELIRQRVGLLRPEGYTRIGAALRHAGHRLAQLRVRRNLLVVVSDAKPTDYDQYEGRYGVLDIHKAVAELRMKNIHTAAVTIAAGIKKPANQMFGSQSTVCSTSGELVRCLHRQFAQFLVANR